ncbi:MAG: three-Cys-motif partner protein TcmP [Bacteroidia bacterium]
MKNNEQNDSKSHMFGHSEAKTRLLREYMAAYLGILSNTSWIRDVYLFDLFSGPGIYENNGKGSPVIFLEEIKRAYDSVVARRGQEKYFHCRFNDHDAVKIDALKQNVTNENLALGNKGDIQYSSLDYKVSLDNLLALVNAFNNERGFAFIDPYGYSEIALRDIKRVLQTGKMEVLLFMPTHFMYRFRENATPEALIRFLDDLDISEQVKGVKGLAFIEIVLNGFQAKLGYEYFVDSFAIERERNQFFCLFFFTSNKLGYLKMLEAKWKVDKEDGRGWTNDSEGGLFAKAPSANTLKLKRLLKEFLSKTGRSNESIFNFTIDNRFLPIHTNEILREFEQNGTIEVITFNYEKRRKGAFYLSMDNIKKNPNKITVKLKQ